MTGTGTATRKLTRYGSLAALIDTIISPPVGNVVSMVAAK